MMNDNEFGHKQWPTVPGERTLEKIRELIEAPIYVLVYNSFRDSYDGRGYWEEDVYTEDYGFFREESKAQEKADQLNDYGSKYATYVLGTQRANKRLEEAHAQKMVAWDALEEKGLDPATYMPKPTLKISTVKSFEEWKSTTREDSYYTVQTVEFNRELDTAPVAE